MKPNERRCLSCHKIAPKEAFWRIVRVYPSREIQINQGMGRSAYLCPEKACLEKAMQKNRLGRALKVKNPLPDSIYQQLAEDLALRASNLSS